MLTIKEVLSVYSRHTAVAPLQFAITTKITQQKQNNQEYFLATSTNAIIRLILTRCLKIINYKQQPYYVSQPDIVDISK